MRNTLSFGLFLAIIIGQCLLTACTETPSFVDNFDRGPILENLAENVIIPSFEDFSVKTQAMETSLSAFVNAPNNTTLEVAQSSWVEAKLSWKKAEMFGFGPVDDLSYATSMDFWPTSAVGLENEAKSYDGSGTYLEDVGSNKKGFPAIEYFLFSADAQTVIAAFSDEKRQGYLKALTKKLASQAKEIATAWKGDYKTAFISNDGNDAGASATLLANNMIILVETIKNKKLDTPGGLQKGREQKPTQVEAYYSKKSTEMIIANLQSVRAVFTGNEGGGFDDYLNALNVKSDEGSTLSEDITAQIDASLAAAMAIENPLQMAIETEQEKVQTLFARTQKLTVLMKTDMMSQLGLSVTFSDNDGD